MLLLLFFLVKCHCGQTPTEPVRIYRSKSLPNRLHSLHISDPEIMMKRLPFDLQSSIAQKMIELYSFSPQDSTLDPAFFEAKAKGLYDKIKGQPKLISKMLDVMHGQNPIVNPKLLTSLMILIAEKGQLLLLTYIFGHPQLVNWNGQRSSKGIYLLNFFSFPVSEGLRATYELITNFILANWDHITPSWKDYWWQEAFRYAIYSNNSKLMQTIWAIQSEWYFNIPRMMMIENALSIQSYNSCKYLLSIMDESSLAYLALNIFSLHKMKLMELLGEVSRHFYCTFSNCELNFFFSFLENSDS
jgi:hypothetical protein